MKKLKSLILIMITIAALAVFAGNAPDIYGSGFYGGNEAVLSGETSAAATDGDADGAQDGIAINYYTQKYGALDMINIELYFTNEQVRLINESSSDSYTLSDYYNEFASLFCVPELCSYESDANGLRITLYITTLYQSYAAGAGTYDVKRDSSWFNVHYELKYTNPLTTLADLIRSYYENPGIAAGDERLTWQYAFAAGLAVNGTTLLRSAYDIFPALKNYGISSASTFNMALPRGAEKSSGSIVVYNNAEYYSWQKDAQEITYSYFVPNTTGWAATLLIVVLVVVAILLAVFWKSRSRVEFFDGNNPVLKSRYTAKVPYKLLETDNRIKGEISYRKNPEAANSDEYSRKTENGVNDGPIDIFDDDTAAQTADAPADIFAGLDDAPKSGEENTEPPSAAPENGENKDGLTESSEGSTESPSAAPESGENKDGDDRRE